MMLSIFSCVCWLFVYFLWRNIYSNPLPVYIDNWVIFFLLLSCNHSLYILDTRPLPDIGFADISPHSVSCPCTLLIVSFDAPSFKFLMKSHLSIISFVAYAFDVISKNLLPNVSSSIFTSMFSPKKT